MRCKSVSSNIGDAVMKFTMKSKRRLDVVTQRVAEITGHRIVDRTPVREGYARGGWNASKGAPNYARTDRRDPSGGIAKTEITAVANTLKATDRFSIGNGQPHIRALENGKSNQAPAGMVKITEMEVPSIIKQAVAEAKGRVQ
jgi:hypothetical protein